MLRICIIHSIKASIVIVYGAFLKTLNPKLKAQSKGIELSGSLGEVVGFRTQAQQPPSLIFRA